MIDKNRVYLLHILECIADIERYTQNNSARFLNNDLVRNATLRQLQIMSESTMRLSANIKEEMSDIEWKKLAAFRNILVHDYMGEIDEKLVWDHIEHQLPELKTAVETTFKQRYGK